MKLRHIILSTLLITSIISSYAITDKEMDKARAITAKLYLRWANDGSGYLDDINPNSMSELTSKLKGKDKENIKDFYAAETKVDFKSWGKEEMVKYWSETFFTSSKLSAKGKAARSKVKRKLQEMNVTKPTEIPQEVAKQIEESAPSLTAVDSVAMTPSPELTSEKEFDSLTAEADSILSQTDVPVAAPKRESNYTMVYVIILIILVGVVIFLVFYASKVLKNNNSNRVRDNQEDLSQRETHRNNSTSSVINRPTVDAEQYAILQSRYDALMAENNRLTLELDNARIRMRQLTDQIANREQLTSAGGSTTRRNNATDSIATGTKEIYLGRVNNNGLFVRADRELNPDASVFILRTTDGYTGTFRVITDPSVQSRLIGEPERYIVNGCSGEMLEDTEGCSAIITETAGTAVFEDGCWRVMRAAKVYYQ